MESGDGWLWCLIGLRAARGGSGKPTNGLQQARGAARWKDGAAGRKDHCREDRGGTGRRGGSLGGVHRAGRREP